MHAPLGLFRSSNVRSVTEAANSATAAAALALLRVQKTSQCSRHVAPNFKRLAASSGASQVHFRAITTENDAVGLP